MRTGKLQGFRDKIPGGGPCATGGWETGISDDDYRAFERVIAETLDKRPMPLLGYCLTPNHWHFLLWPEKH